MVGFGKKKGGRIIRGNDVDYRYASYQGHA
jgi:hypothetical protein